MSHERRWGGLCVGLVCCLVVGIAYGVDNDEKMKLTGLITERAGEA